MGKVKRFISFTDHRGRDLIISLVPDEDNEIKLTVDNESVFLDLESLDFIYSALPEVIEKMVANEQKEKQKES